MSEPSSADRERAKRLADELIDYAVYAPLGAAMTVADQLPELVRRGRERFSGQVKLAQVLGRVAVGSARRQAEAVFRGPPPRETPNKPSEAPPDSSVAARAIPGYDQLTAAEVIGHLPSLTRDDLRSIREYEESHRGRRTVLGRIAQLLDGAAS